MKGKSNQRNQTPQKNITEKTSQKKHCGKDVAEKQHEENIVDDSETAIIETSLRR